VNADPVGPRLETQAQAFAAMGSPLYAALAQAALADYRARGPVHGFFANAPERSAYSTPCVRLFGAFHYLALAGEAPNLAAHLPSCGGDGSAAEAWLAARALLESRGDEIGELFVETPQTNEVARSTVLLAGACAVAQSRALPLRLFEIGASAGLNARLDCYRFEGNGWAWGDARSPLVLRNREQSGRPRLVDALHIVERAACDLRPLNIDSDRDRMRLLSFVWPDQHERFVRLRAAFDAASTEPLNVVATDMFEWIIEAVRPRDGTATIVMHSVMVEHLSEADRARLGATIDGIAASARADAPVAWIRMECDPATMRYETRVSMWPGASEILIARSDGHAQGIEWLN
jgi:hypothetical protein